MWRYCPSRDRWSDPNRHPDRRPRSKCWNKEDVSEVKAGTSAMEAARTYQAMLIRMASRAGAVYMEIRKNPTSTPSAPIHVKSIWTAGIISFCSPEVHLFKEFRMMWSAKFPDVIAIYQRSGFASYSAKFSHHPSRFQGCPVTTPRTVMPCLSRGYHMLSSCL